MFRVAISLVLVLAASADAAAILFEGNVFPEDLGWERQGTNDADRWIDDGWFVQSMDLGDWAPPPFGENDKYKLLLTEFASSSHFFAEARMSTDGPASEIVGTAPATFLLGGTAGIAYHLTIADSLVRFINSFDGPTLFFDLTPGVPHTFRFDVFDDQWYEFRIDDVIVDAGLPYGHYPTDDSFIFFGGRYYENHNTNRWDYLTFGKVPEPAGAALLLVGAVWVGRRRRTQFRVRR